ncbi:hypothetical protein THOE12_100033 [Vibrio rotiferianus]|nr:hypothetical protein THOE12_100033 [Vibrio rotiferianus]
MSFVTEIDGASLKVYDENEWMVLTESVESGESYRGQLPHSKQKKGLT